MARSGRAPRMIVDFEQCIRIPDEDRRIARPNSPYHCGVCEDEGSYSGQLRFEGDPVPVCGNRHESQEEGAEAPLMIPC